MSSNKKRQQTMAKRTREQAVKEKRALKLAKKHAAAAERRANALDPTPQDSTVWNPTVDDDPGAGSTD